MKEITQELLKELLYYNPDTGIFTWKNRGKHWFKRDADRLGFNNRYAGKIAGTKYLDGRTYYIQIRLLNKSLKAHRLAWLYVYGNFPSGQIDHKSGDGTNNSICNLRDVDSLTNNKNRKKSINNKSGVTGVHWDSRVEKWRARIVNNYKLHSLGWFSNIDDAAKARKDAEKEHGYHENHGRKL